jgi:hypothetical protein
VAQVKEPGGAPGARGGVAHLKDQTILTAGLLPIIPPQFFNCPPHRYLPVAFLVGPPLDQTLLFFLGSCHEDIVELTLNSLINPVGLLRPKPRIIPWQPGATIRESASIEPK